MQVNRWFASACAAVFIGLAAGALAADAPSAVADPALEKRVMDISEELRCLVCQNQTIADSHAELAVDLRNQVREMLLQGKSESEIREYMVQRYGDFVLYRPPVKTTTWVLWVGPFVLLLAGLLVLMVKLKQRAKRVVEGDKPLQEDQKRRLDDLLGQGASASHHHDDQRDK